MQDMATLFKPLYLCIFTSPRPSPQGEGRGEVLSGDGIHLTTATFPFNLNSFPNRLG